jgi:hypothetical protein
VLTVAALRQRSQPPPQPLDLIAASRELRESLGRRVAAPRSPSLAGEGFPWLCVPSLPELVRRAASAPGFFWMSSNFLGNQNINLRAL